MFSKSPYLRSPITGQVSDSGFELQGSTGSARLAWDMIIKTKESDEMILLYQSPILMNMVCRDFFRSPADWDEARNLIRSGRSRRTGA